MKKYVDKDKLQEFTTKLTGKYKQMFSSPLVASTVAGMTDEEKVYVYVGSETGYTNGNWYYYNGSAWVSGGVYNAVAVETDDTLLVEGQAADSKATGDAISAVDTKVGSLSSLETEDKSSIVAAINEAAQSGGSGTGMSEDFKQALHDILEKVAYIDGDGQDYLDALDSAMWPPVDLVSISAVYTQSGTVYDTDSLNSLKSDLVVTAHYSDGTTGVVTNYTLSGTLVVGTSTITVTYGGKTTTFMVTVTEYIDTRTLLYNWDLTNSLIDTVESKEATVSDATQDSSGLHISSVSGYAKFENVLSPSNDNGYTIEVDVASYSRQGTNHGRFLMFTGDNGFIYRSTGKWAWYSGSWTDSEYTDSTMLNGKKLTITLEKVASNTYLYTVYCDSIKLVEKQLKYAGVANIMLGSNAGNSAYDSVFTAIRVYEGV